MKFSEIVKQAVFDVLRQSPQPDLRNRSSMVKNLTFLYHTMVASESLLELAVEHSKHDVTHDYFVKHLDEERGHDIWMAADLKTEGISVSQSTVPVKAVELAGSQYYLVRHVDVAALLGYMVLMECFPLTGAAIDELESLHGKPLLRTLRYHAVHDVDHGADLLALIDSLPEERKAIVLQSAVQSAAYFGAAAVSFS